MDQLSPGLLVGGILALFTLLGFLRSFVVFFFNLIALALGALAGLWTYNNGYLIASRVIDDYPEPWMVTTLGITAFVLTVVTIRKILAFLSGKSSQEGQTRTAGFGLPGGTFGLLLGLGFAYFMLTGVRYAGTIAELERLTHYIGGQIDESSKTPFFARLKNWIDESSLGQWHQKIDYLNDLAETNAAKLSIIQNDPEKFAKATASGEKEMIYDALPVAPAIQEAYRRHNYAAILQSQRDNKAPYQNFTSEELRRIDVEKALGLRK